MSTSESKEESKVESVSQTVISQQPISIVAVADAPVPTIAIVENPKEVIKR
jgi:hypothetical protein